MEILENQTCPGCGRGCPLSHPQCGLGFEYMQEALQKAEGEGADIFSDTREAKDSARCSRNERKGDHGKGRGHQGHGSHGHGEHRGGRRGHGGPHGRGYGESALHCPADERLARVFRHCSRMLVHRERHQGGRASVLAVLASHGEMTQARLAEKLDIRAASASELLGKMEGDGLVSRSPDTDDGRAHLVQLTDAGRLAAEEVMDERKRQDERLFRALNDDEKEQLVQLLDKVAKSWP